MLSNSIASKAHTQAKTLNLGLRVHANADPSRSSPSILPSPLPHSNYTKAPAPLASPAPLNSFQQHPLKPNNQTKCLVNVVELLLAVLRPPQHQNPLLPLLRRHDTLRLLLTRRSNSMRRPCSSRLLLPRQARDLDCLARWRVRLRKFLQNIVHARKNGDVDTALPLGVSSTSLIIVTEARSHLPRLYANWCLVVSQ